jgi:hypothetical protein
VLALGHPFGIPLDFYWTLTESADDETKIVLFQPGSFGASVGDKGNAGIAGHWCVRGPGLASGQ